MIIKGSSAKLEVITSSGADIDIQITSYRYADGATTATPIPDNVKITTATTTTVLAGIDDTTTQKIGFMQIMNIDASLSNDVELLHYSDSGVSGTAQSVRVFKVTLLAGESMTFNGRNWTHNPSNFGTFTPVVVSLASDQSNSTTTPTELTGLSVVNLQPGTYVANYYIWYQNGATTTGIRFDLNFTGTVTVFLWNQSWVDASATAATAAADQDAVAATGHVYAAFASRAKGSAGRGTTISVDTANGDMLMRIEALFIVTVAGDLELWHGSEVAAISTVKAGSSLILHKTG